MLENEVEDGFSSENIISELIEIILIVHSTHNAHKLQIY